MKTKNGIKKYFLLFFLFSFFPLFPVAVHASSILEKPVTLSMYSCPLEDILNEISRQTGIRFSYSPQAVDVRQLASLDAQSLPVKDALRQALGSKYEYKATRKFAILQKSKVKITLSPALEQQNLEVEKVEYLYITNQRRVKKLCYTDSGTALDDCPIITNNKNSIVMKRQIIAIMLATAPIVSAEAQQPSTVSQQLGEAGKSFISLVEEVAVGTTQAVKVAADKVGQQASNLKTAVAQSSGSTTAGALKVEPESQPDSSVPAAPKAADTLAAAQTADTLAIAQAAAATVPAAAAVPPAAATPASSDSVHPVIFTLFYPFSFPELQTEKYAYNASFSWICGINSGVRGVELGGLANINRHYMSGVQLAGVSNLSLGSVTGVQMAGVANLAVRDTAKAQMAGVVNVAQSSEFQAAGVANVAYLNGNVQLAGVANLAYLNGKVQLAGISNLSAKGATEAQIAGISNAARSAEFQAAGIANLAYSNGKVQVAGIANVADTSRCQVGLVNVAKRAGVQVGLVNVCDTSGGVMVGLINVARKGGLHEFEVSAGLVDNISVAYRLGTARLYTSAGLSYRFNDSRWLSGVGLGTQIPISKSWGINVEGVSQHVITSRFWEHGSFNHLSQLRVLGCKRFAKHFAVFAGPTFYIYNTNTSKSNSVDLKTPYTIYSDRHGNVATKAWIGFSAGIRL
ncbi:MAG: STN domain-containing protein [Prevotellaceae bacterium]|nr:STN domain-containing protein [Prevotellaceae bacterium]